MLLFYKSRVRSIAQWSGLLAAVAVSALAAQAQTTDPLAGQTVNGQPLTYLNTVRVLQPGVTDVATIPTLALPNRQQTIGYADGFGRPVQQIAVQASAGGGDIIAPVVYDQFGSVPQQLLPYTRLPASQGLFDTGMPTNQPGFYSSGLKVAHDPRPYGTVSYEASPLGRATAQTKPGAAFAAHAATVAYQTNSGSTWPDAVRIWQGTANIGVYPANQLTVQVMTDEDQRQTQVFRDKLGRVILQRKLEATSAGTNLLDTYSVYDESGDVAYTVPPGAVAQMRLTNSWSLADPAFVGRWLFQYVYDDRHRLVERTVPGAAAVYTIYDQFDRPVLVQDGAHRTAGTWLFTKYDEQGRPVVLGVHYRTGVSRQQLQAEADAFTGEFESLNAIDYSTTANRGYTTTATYPSIQDGVAGSYLLSVTRYDDYDLDQNGSPDFSYRSQGLGLGTEPVASAQTLGQVTVTQTRIINSGNQLGGWLTNVVFYDEYGNVIQKQSNSLMAPGDMPGNTTTVLYRAGGFVPQVLRTIKAQASNTAGNVVVTNRFAYLPTGQLRQVWQQNTHGTTIDPEVLLASSTYNELGQLVEKNLHSLDGGASFLQSEDFRYTLQGQLLSINNSALQNDGGLTNDDANDIFGLDLVREENNSQSLGNTPRFDGGISAIRWQAHNAQQQTNPERVRSYRFAYDGLGRLRDAQFAAKDAAGSWTQELGAYDEKGVTYDQNGNITALNRATQRWSGYAVEQIDQLQYHYDQGGNQLTSIADLSGDARGFRPASTAASYQYDANGSLTNDPSKGLTLRYNVLNKVDQQVAAPNSNGPSGTVTYDYDATGTVLRRTVTGTSYGGQSLSKTVTYVDGFTYESSGTQNGLSAVPTPEGRALLLPATPAKMVYEYHLRDHLGNLRVAFRADRQPEQLHLAMEDPTSNEEGPYPKFQNVAAARSPAGYSYHGPTVASGTYSAAVSASQPGPLTRMLIAQGDQLKISLWYATPSGTQYPPNQPSDPKPPGPVLDSFTGRPVWRLAPTLTTTLLSQSREAPQTALRPTLGVQVGVTGLLTQLLKKKPVPLAAAAPAPAATASFGTAPAAETAIAYVALRVYDQQNQLLQEWHQEAPVANNGNSVISWNQLRFLVTPDLSTVASRAGYLEIQLMNDGGQPVYFDSLTVRHPKDVVLVSQENHYYPLGLALSGVAVNTTAQPQTSKALFNGGSELQDDVLGEAGIYSTFFRTYDPVIGRFQGVDPLAAQYANWTPYQFAAGNPLSFNDPTGALVHQPPVFDFSASETSGRGGGGGGGFGDRGYGGSPVNDWGSGYFGGGTAGNDLSGGGSMIGYSLGLVAPVLGYSGTTRGYWAMSASSAPTLDEGSTDLAEVTLAAQFYPSGGDGPRPRDLTWASLMYDINNFARGFRGGESKSLSPLVLPHALGMPVEAAEEMLKREVERKGITNMKVTERNLKIGARLLGTASVSSTAYRSFEDGVITTGDVEKVVIQGAFVLFGGAYLSIGYTILDMTVGAMTIGDSTGIDLTDRIGHGIDAERAGMGYNTTVWKSR